MRIVLDTNVLVSGIFFGGIPSKILDRWAENRIMAYATPSILDEYLRVIKSIAPKIHNPHREYWSALLPDVCHLISDEHRPRRISRDPSDDKFIFCAINSDAEYLVTGDKDLKILKADFDFEIVSPAEFMHDIS